MRTPTQHLARYAACHRDGRIPFVGHPFEGREPAFVDDSTAPAIGPLFVVAEVVFAHGFRPTLAHAVHDGEARALREALDARS